MNFGQNQGRVGVLRRDRSNFCVVVWCAAVLEYEISCERVAMFFRLFISGHETTKHKLLCSHMFDRVALCGSAQIVFTNCFLQILFC